ncbi:MAG: hypothetical protein NZ922_02635 [Candidatus Methanomethyliaceae archaeon]|nr:hypothetical protein [Candidatus Methanomethyliaceae archaeon]MDW7970926.1 hypothetical protein [Nitrososphaerota archaeon]
MSLELQQIEAFRKMVDKVFDEAKDYIMRVLNESAERAFQILDDSEKNSILKLNELLSAYIERADIESKKEISKAELELKMHLLKLKESLIEKVIMEAKLRIMKYCESDEYISDMIENLRKLSSKMNIGLVLIKDRDIERIGMENLKSILGNCEIKSHKIEVGGFIAISKDEKVYVDKTIENIFNRGRILLRSKIASLLFG